MKNLDSLSMFNIADPANKRRLMREALAALQGNRDLGFVQLHIVAAFIDGLAAGRKNETKKAFLEYIQKNFTDLCHAIGAELIYEKIRNKAVHEFALEPPFALAHSDSFSDPEKYVETADYAGQRWTVLNLEKVVADFRKHLDALDSAGPPAQH